MNELKRKKKLLNNNYIFIKVHYVLCHSDVGHVRIMRRRAQHSVVAFVVN